MWQTENSSSFIEIKECDCLNKKKNVYVIRLMYSYNAS